MISAKKANEKATKHNEDEYAILMKKVENKIIDTSNNGGFMINIVVKNYCHTVVEEVAAALFNLDYEVSYSNFNLTVRW